MACTGVFVSSDAGVRRDTTRLGQMLHAVLERSKKWRRRLVRACHFFARFFRAASMARPRLPCVRSISANRGSTARTTQVRRPLHHRRRRAAGRPAGQPSPNRNAARQMPRPTRRDRFLHRQRAADETVPASCAVSSSTKKAATSPVGRIFVGTMNISPSGISTSRPLVRM